MSSCETSGNNPAYHFAGAGKMIEVGKGGQRDVDEYQLSRFACYLIAQNGVPCKPTAEEFKTLSGAAQDAAAQNKMFGVFHDAGHKGLYGGLGSDAIKQRKAIPEKDNLLVRMNATELDANQFRMTQTRDKLERDGVRSQAQAIPDPRTGRRLNFLCDHFDCAGKMASGSSFGRPAIAGALIDWSIHGDC